MLRKLASTRTATILVLITVTGCNDESKDQLDSADSQAKKSLYGQSSQTTSFNSGSFNDPFRSNNTSGTNDPFSSNTANVTTGSSFSNTTRDAQDINPHSQQQKHSTISAARQASNNSNNWGSNQPSNRTAVYVPKSSNTYSSPTSENQGTNLTGDQSGTDFDHQLAQESSPSETVTENNSEASAEQNPPEESNTESLAENAPTEPLEPVSQEPKINCPVNGELPTVWDNSYNRLQLAMAGCYIQ